MKPTRRRNLGLINGQGDDNNPLSIMANLFETGLVFALGFMVSLVSSMNLTDMLNPDAKVTVTTERKDGIQVLVKDGKKTTIRRMTKNIGEGEGHRLGVAYKLEDGSVIYVPENDEKQDSTQKNTQ
ncbi:hypothetical protein FHS57_000995 [Runella defluvii]|uniref:DUF2149 domain-containing protein n=1 Tax=Runella defluvii TaxID=370973 RepID=A0A7W6EP55_9BACT|nr:DUF2149 domain-containing protein [Runella defluvii]MBB3837001.1 hypothetical protein [Runella defluvii]